MRPVFNEFQKVLLQYICLSLYIFKNLFLTKEKYIQVPHNVCLRHSQNIKSEFIQKKTSNDFVVYKYMYCRTLNLQGLELEKENILIYNFKFFDYKKYYSETWSKRYNCKKNPAYERQRISGPMRIARPTQFWRGCVI